MPESTAKYGRHISCDCGEVVRNRPGVSSLPFTAARPRGQREHDALLSAMSVPDARSGTTRAPVVRTPPQVASTREMTRRP